MGIKYLWTILAPFGERKPLYELQGKTVAIDLSCWVCEAQNITDYYVQPKMYLRNLYFRTCFLLLMEVNPVFVLEGKAPELKYDTIAARNAIQFKGAKPKADGAVVGKDRSRFNFVLRRCEEMLKYMGLACVKGKGEAEAFCAYLNAEKLVDGCISQDSDCFAYGAQVVYRNFSISQQGAHAGSGGAVDVYNIEKAKEEIDFGRNKIIALALLCGSDYADGVCGIGKEATMKLFEKVSDKDILARLQSWQSDNKYYDELYKKLKNKNICTSCGHSGKLQIHTKLGCRDCKTNAGCDCSKFNSKRLEMKHEVSMRSKAVADPSFPNKKLVNEFLIRKDNFVKLDLEWKQPDLISFVKFTVSQLQWDHLYAFEKFLPILTRWQLKYAQLKQSRNLKGILIPERIKKIRNPKGIPSFEIIWKSQGDDYKDLIPANQLTEVNLEKLWSTIEPQNIVREAYPDLVEAFERSKIKPKKASKRGKAKEVIDAINVMLANTSISEPQPKKKRGRKPRELQPPNVQHKPIDSYFKTAILNNCQAEVEHDSFNPNVSKFGDENDLDLSDIVQDIVSRPPPAYVRNNLSRLNYYAVDKENGDYDLNKSSFFITETVENDYFETSMKYEMLSDSSDEMGDDSDESFSYEYVPLLERLKNKA